MKRTVIGFFGALNCLVVLGQHHAFWPMDSIMVRFDWNGVVSVSSSSAGRLTSETSFASEDGQWLYSTSVGDGNIFNGGIYDEQNQLIHANVDLNMSRTYSSGKFLPYSTSNSIGFVSQRLDPATVEFQTWYHEIDHNSRQLVKKIFPLILPE